MGIVRFRDLGTGSLRARGVALRPAPYLAGNGPCGGGARLVSSYLDPGVWRTAVSAVGPLGLGKGVIAFGRGA